MFELLQSAYDHYFRLELLPAYLATVTIWVLTSSVRGVVWSLVTQAWMVVSVNSTMMVDFVTRYQDVLRDPELNQLTGPSYAFALWNAFFAVPVQVLEEGEAEYGQYGVMLRSWWTALLVTFGDYIPDLSMRSGYSYLAYSRASWEAWATVCQRVVAIVKGFCWFVLLVLSLVVHLPMRLFDLLEFLALGTTGLAALLVLANSLNLMFEWTSWLTSATVIVVVVGIVTHIWRLSQWSGHLEKATPRVVVKKALRSVRREVNRCNRREAACLASLHGSRVHSTATSRPTATPLGKRSSVLPRRPSCDAPMTTSPTTTSPMITSPTTTSPSTSYPPGVESGEAAVVLNVEEQRVVQCLRDMEHDRADRGRSAYGRGVCPVPGNETPEPASSAVPHASGHCNPSYSPCCDYLA